ncbi:nickel pincer cofactor biosynthesis protein LarB [Leptolyngbya sp. FACHB-261]|uniref:nickel pincer cofactor biosynthesis protein LarB n=1 Tax=Leptolyngbya sp. FACHB-261 TaxID=2692806 RepID=UPI0016863BC9|nr:nickel pincer cofactor biosynthesis protein LarB [Leptolyngbya sp. FACHB-261]MBD2100229.1 nickel pincer cofactor biosynthesis protein LarB [Leptolyngbya sp. FACHB-261]
MSDSLDPEALQDLLEAVAAGQVNPQTALEKLRHLPFEVVDNFARLDHHRCLRNGFPEVIWGPGKTSAQLISIFKAMRGKHAVVMATRIEPAVFCELERAIPDLIYYPTARICSLQSTTPPQRPGTVTLLCAGTADLAVAEEAAVTVELCGFQAQRLWDVGVAGLHRLLSQHQVIAEAQVLVVVAGMEGALASVVAGMADCPVIAVPTSVGYGASFNGLAALLTMLNSCAAGVGVMNIDNGFGAAILAGQILRTAYKISTKDKAN